MDNVTFGSTTRTPSVSINGSARRLSPQTTSGSSRPSSFLDSQFHICQVVVNKDEKGYGMKVTGDNPVYVQSVKEGGAAEKAGLQAGDKIIKVNGVNVIASTHMDVVDLIKSSSQVVLTVQQRMTGRSISSPGTSTGRPVTSHSHATITSPQPVDNEKQYQLQLEKEQHYRLMIEKEQRYIDKLRSQLAVAPDEKKFSELAKTERNLQTLQAMLHRTQSEPPSSPLPHHRLVSPNGNWQPPPLPKKTNRGAQVTNRRSKTDPLPSIPIEINANVVADDSARTGESDVPPPLPPRHTHPNADAVNSINKQMSYPLVATCATLVNNCAPNSPTHHRTKSSPDSLGVINAAEASKRLITSESLNDLSRQEEWESPEAPPGTPPPPYQPSPRPDRRAYGCHNSEETDGYEELNLEENSPIRGRIIASSSPIHAATPQVVQQPIISMEDDEISDQEMEQPEEHGPFKSLSRLWEHPPHMAVFTNYILSNADPNSLLFFLLTNLFKKGNAKEMRKWALEIHSCFLVPGAPLRLGNVDENVAREIDDVLTREYDKEEILRKIFWKARARAKEELAKQLADFQQKRTAGLGTIYGPCDSTLMEAYNDKSKEIRLYENLFQEKLDKSLDEVEKECFDPRKYYTTAGIVTVLTRIFGLRSTSHNMDRCPTFVSKEKSLKTKFMGLYSRKLTVQGHQFVAQQYYTVVLCNNCHQVIYGIAPQGYQCTDCSINLHRQCVRLYDDSCPGPKSKKDRGISKFIRIRPHESGDHRRKISSHFIHMERDRRQAEDKDMSSDLNDTGESKPSQPVSRSGSDRRPDSVREEFNKHNDNASCSSPGQDAGNEHDETSKSHTESPSVASSGGHKKRGGNNINRSESVKEQSEKQRDTRKQRRNISDPSHNTTSNSVVDLEHTALSNTTDSGSSSNSSISTNDRLSESPSNSTEAVRESGAESDMDAESQPLDWHELVTEEQLNNLQPHEKKRQDVINELFHTEISHVTSLKVLYKFFHKSLQESSALKPDELSLIFPNIKEVLDVHVQFRSIMIRKRKSDPIVKELGDMLLNMFGGSMGEAFRKAAATFCERQQLALEFIKERRKRDSKFDGVLCDCEKRRQCRRLQLQAILPVEMQRLSKYPLLLERLIGAVQSSPESEELEKLKRAHQLSKDIVNYVNEATKEALNRARLGDIQKHLDQSNFERNEAALDLTRHRLVIEGPMQLRRPNKGPVPVHVLLLEEIVVILQKEGDRYVLKYFTSGIPAQPLSPIIKISSLLVRANAVHKDALFLVNTSTTNTQKMAQMYDLITEDDSKRALWFKHFSDATKAYQEREGKTRRPEPPHDSDEGPESVQELSQPPDVAERAEEVDHEDDGHDPNYQLHENTSDTTTKESIEETTTTPEGVKTRITAEEWPLIQPSHVHVEIPPVHSAESRLTHIEQIRRKDEEVIKALTDKEDLVADLLCIPRQNFQTIADMSSDLELVVADPLERIMAAIYQTDRLQRALNEALTVSTESEAVQATGGRHPSCSSQTHVRCDHQPAVPTTIIQDVTTKLSHQLTRLLEQLKQHDEEKIMLRNELHKVREKLHEKHCLHNVTLIEDDPVEAAGDAPETNEEVTSEPGEPSVS